MTSFFKRSEKQMLLDQHELKKAQLGAIEKELIAGSMSLSLQAVRGLKARHEDKQKEIRAILKKIKGIDK